MDIPHDRLTPEALHTLAEEFVTQEGTDYGAVEASREVKVTQVLEQIKQGLVIIRFDPLTQTCGLFPKE